MALLLRAQIQGLVRAVMGSLVMMLLTVILGFVFNPAFAQTDYNEAPMLGQRVAVGELPPVHERLPENPVVVPVVERIGEYGGTWRTALIGGADHFWMNRTIGYETLVRWDPTWTELVPNIAESYEVSEDATEFTFHLRRGIRWSDGHPFTAGDIMFWYEDVFLNESLTPVYPLWLTSDGEPVTVEKIDDYTVVFTFSAPNGFFLQQIASKDGVAPNIYPRHYLEQFHPTYNPDGIDALVREAGLPDWINLFENRGGVTEWQFNAERPVLHGWVILNDYGTGTRLVAERNPYFWKVDPEGNQLPYIDRVVFDYLSSPEVLLLRAMNGEIDMMDRRLGTPGNRPVLVDNMEHGDYRLLNVTHSNMNVMLIHLNMNHNDPVKREIFQNKDFRIGLSHAINRQELIDLIYVGQGEPWQAAPHRETPIFNEQLAKQYTEYDVDLANEHLDRAGYAERDSQGFRLGPDGNRISFAVQVVAVATDHVDLLELIRMYWQEVGVDMQVRVIDRDFFYVNTDANEFDAQVWKGDGGMADALIWPQEYAPVDSSVDGARYATRWARWFNDQPGGEEPPDVVKQQMDLYNQLRSVADEQRQFELMAQILEIAADQFYSIGIALPGDHDRYNVVRNNFRNVPEEMPASGGSFKNPAVTNTVQYFIEGSSR
jgi:peptide/nickel transport system substrate-binding protein